MIVDVLSMVKNYATINKYNIESVMYKGHQVILSIDICKVNSLKSRASLDFWHPDIDIKALQIS